VPRTRHEADTEAFEVVQRIVEGVDFELAAVAGTRVDVANTERPAEHGADLLLERLAHAQAVVRLRRRLGGDPDGRDLSQRLQHETARVRCLLQIMATVGEVEGLVDEREVRNDVVNHRMFQNRPVLPRRIVRTGQPWLPRGESSKPASRSAARRDISTASARNSTRGRA
jgi:hypothetical protein